MDHKLEDGVSHGAVVQRSRTSPSLKGWLQLRKEMVEVTTAARNRTHELVTHLSGGLFTGMAAEISIRCKTVCRYVNAVYLGYKEEFLCVSICS